jgi:hypothetical protein
LTKAQIVLAFSRALDESKFFPVPALLRDFGSIGDATAAEAKEELLRIVTAMRGAHGPKLRPILGKVKYGTEEEPLEADGIYRLSSGTGAVREAMSFLYCSSVSIR